MNPNFKGYIGEQFFANMLIDRGYIVYGVLNGSICPHCNKKGYGQTISHPFDFLCFKRSEQKPFSFEDSFICEVKTKERRKEQTGFDLADYIKYKAFSDCTPIPFWVVFIDSDRIYGSTIDELNIKCEENGMTYPHRIDYEVRENNISFKKSVILFPTSRMHTLGNLSPAQKQKLQYA